MKINILNSLEIFIFAKDKNLRYLYCNESFAKVAGLDSPTQIKKKRDHDLCWRKQASLYNSGDRWVLNGGILVNVPEPQVQPSKIANVLTTKTLLKGKNNKLIGLTGSYIDITGYIIKRNNSYYDPKEKKLYLEEFPNSEYLTEKEVIVLQHLLLGWSTEKIATTICKSVKTVESYIIKIKYKLQCDSNSEIASRATELGLTFLLDSFTIEKSNNG